jgi:hypothetical protein
MDTERKWHIKRYPLNKRWYLYDPGWRIIFDASSYEVMLDFVNGQSPPPVVQGLFDTLGLPYSFPNAVNLMRDGGA